MHNVQAARVEEDRSSYQNIKEPYSSTAGLTPKHSKVISTQGHQHTNNTKTEHLVAYIANLAGFASALLKQGSHKASGIESAHHNEMVRRT